MVDLMIPNSKFKKKENKMEKKTEMKTAMLDFFKKHGADESTWDAATKSEFESLGKKDPNADDKIEYKKICETLEVTPSEAFKSFIVNASKKPKEEVVTRTEVGVTFIREDKTNRISTYISGKVKDEALVTAIQEAKIQAIKDLHKVVA